MTLETGLKSVVSYGRTNALVALVLFLLVSCGGRGKQLGDAVTSRDSMAVMSTSNITSLISEDGMIRYRINAESWDMFDRTDPPRWTFEKGVYLEVLDSLMEVSSMIKADTAYYYSDTEIWELRGHVHAENPQDEQFDTELLYWDQRKEKVYSDERIAIRQVHQILYGRGFESNQDFTRYTIRKSEGVFPIEDE